MRIDEKMTCEVQIRPHYAFMVEDGMKIRQDIRDSVHSAQTFEVPKKTL
jgi:hypothetical protein